MALELAELICHLNAKHIWPYTQHLCEFDKSGSQFQTSKPYSYLFGFYTNLFIFSFPDVLIDPLNSRFAHPDGKRRANPLS